MNSFIEEISYTKYGHQYEIIIIVGLGTRNGYVAVTEDSPLYGLDYDDLYNYSRDIYVHGGLTYSGTLQSDYIIGSINNKWYYGFDCAHLGDGKMEYNEMVDALDSTTVSYTESDKHDILVDYKLKTSNENGYNMMSSIYDRGCAKSKNFVRKECIKLSKFILDIENAISNI